MKYELVALSAIAAVMTGATALAEQPTTQNAQAGDTHTYLVQTTSGAQTTVTIPQGVDINDLLKDAQVVREVAPQSSAWTGVRGENL